MELIRVSRGHEGTWPVAGLDPPDGKLRVQCPALRPEYLKGGKQPEVVQGNGPSGSGGTAEERGGEIADPAQDVCQVDTLLPATELGHGSLDRCGKVEPVQLDRLHGRSG